jgi:hypothetical protein
MTPAGRLLVWRATAIPVPALTASPGTLVPSPLPLSPLGRGQGEGLKGEGLKGEELKGEGPKGAGALAIATAEGLLLPLEVQPENRKTVSWPDFLRGARLSAGARVSEPTP